MRNIHTSKSLTMMTALLVFVSLIFLSAPVIGADELPPVPEAIKSKGILRVGTKCDYPPDGYLNEQGKAEGIEVSLARQIGTYIFGDASKTEIVCVTAANRIPSLVGGKVDLVIATMGISAKRQEVIDFSDPYAWGASSVLTLEESDIQKLADLKGRTVVVLKGAWQIPWFETNLPEAKLMKLDTVSDALQALMQKRADAYAHDYMVQAGLDSKNTKVRMLKEFYKIGFRGAGVRKGESEWLAYVNAAIKKAKSDGLIVTWVDEYANPEVKESLKRLWDPALVPKEGAAAF